MNLKMLSMHNIVPALDWMAEALKPSQIMIAASFRTNEFYTSKKRGDLPTYLR
jgi:hypothetical protein